VGQILYTTTRRTAGEVSTYEDLWRFTLINYNGGPGCLSGAIDETYSSGHPLTWGNVIQYLEPGVCQISIDYVNDIAFMPGEPLPTPTPIIQPTSTPLTPPTIIQPTPTPLPDVEVTPMQPTATPPIDNGYPPPPTATDSSPNL
jgi:hypothetical protein